VKTSPSDDFDLAVVGGGHAGVEAALAAARLGCRVALLTHDPAKIGAMSCNPAVGGLGKGHLVKEIDALGGLMGRAADRAAIQFRRLNLRKGPAVRASRVQVDRAVYARAVKAALRRQAGLRVLAGEAVGIWLDGRAVRGLILADGARLAASGAPEAINSRTLSRSRRKLLAFCGHSRMHVPQEMHRCSST